MWGVFCCLHIRSVGQIRAFTGAGVHACIEVGALDRVNMQKRVMIVTDLDGSLLDDTYSWAAALPALEMIQARGIPLVLNSSKTMAEMREFANALQTMAPVVAENGGLLAVHEASGLLDRYNAQERLKEYVIEINGLPRHFIVAKAHALRVRDGYRFEGFADWTDAQVSEHTGLSETMARHARSRYATEPIVWHDSPARQQLFEAELAKHAIRLVRGGRFLHLMGQVDKADGTQAAIRLYQQAQSGSEWFVIALGDSGNDLAMLEAADIAVVIPHADGSCIQPQAARVVHASSPASVGWNQALLELLDQYK